MPLIVTPGAPDANSYVTLIEAEAILAAELADTTAWDAATTTDKERALVTAAQDIDQGVQWRGMAASPYQALAWPRTGFPYITQDAIPAPLKAAQALQAAWRLAQRAAGTQPGTVPTQELDELRVGPITLDFATPAAPNPWAPVPLPAHVWARLRLYGSAYGGVNVPIVRT